MGIPAALVATPMKGISETVESLWDAILFWLRSTVGPVATLNELLSRASDEERLAAAVKLWVTASLVSAIVTFPALEAFGIGWNNLGFHLATFLALALAWMGGGLIVHRLLRAFRLQSELWPTLIMFVTPAATYTPLFFVLTMANRIEAYGAVKQMKAQNAAMTEFSIVKYFQLASQSPPSRLNQAILLAQLLGSVAVYVLCAESVCQWYRNDRFKTYLCFAVGFYVELALLTGLFPFSILTIYAFQR